MSKAIFLLGVLGKDAKSGQALSPEDMALLGEIADSNGLEVEVVFAIENIKLAGDEKRVRVKHIKEERPRVIQAIRDYEPEYVFCFGRVAAASAFQKGSVVLDEHRRRANRVADIGGKVYVCDSLQRLAAQPGIRKWLDLDIAAAVAGYDEPQFGKYTVLQPGTPEWGTKPKEFGALVGFDLETYPGLNPWDKGARIRMAMVSDKDGEAFVVQATPDSRLPVWLSDLLEDTATVKAGSNIAFDYRWLRRFGYNMSSFVDTSTMEHIIDCTDPNKGLKWLTLRYCPRLGDYSRDHRELLKSRGGKNAWHLLADEEMYTYAGADAEASYITAYRQLQILEDMPYPLALMSDLYPILADMSMNGMKVDTSVTDSLNLRMSEHLSDLREQIQAVLGPVNPASTKQLGQALLDFVPGIDLRINQFVKFMDGDDDETDENMSTSRAILEREAGRHPVIATVLEFRKWSKLHSAFVKTLLEKHLTNGGFIYPNYNSSRVETYRLSASSPNPQQMPRKPGEADPPELNVKRQFVSRFKGGCLLNADYGQMEMRVAAMLSADPALTEAVNTEDVHTAVAAQMMRKNKEDVTPDDRQHAKTVGFATMYGAGARTIGKHLGIHKEEAKPLIEMYFRAYPKLKRYISRVHALVEKDLAVTTPFGLRRTFAAPTYGNWNKWDGFRVKRQAFNTIIQSTAACIMYVALIDIYEKLKSENLKSLLICTVHDSLLIDVAPGELTRVQQIVRQCMAKPRTGLYGVEVTVPLAVDIEVGQSWGELKKVS